MPKNIQIKNVPNDVHQILRQRAVAAGQSLQEYMFSEIIGHARRPTITEVLDRARRQSGSDLDADRVVSDIRADRDAVH